jgi:hypothetical protein
MPYTISDDVFPNHTTAPISRCGRSQPIGMRWCRCRERPSRSSSGASIGRREANIVTFLCSLFSLQLALSVETVFTARRRKGYASLAEEPRFSYPPSNRSNMKGIYCPVPSIQPRPNIRITVQTVSDRIQAVSDLIRIIEKCRPSTDPMRRIVNGKDPVGGEKLS